MTERITQKDLDRALDAHRDALQHCGIAYDGRLGLDIGSKTYGRAYRLFLTDVLAHCQETKRETAAGVAVFNWHEDEEGNPAERVRGWDHADCKKCKGSRKARCSGHFRPPVGDDYLGMTAREAYDTLTARTRAIYDTAAAIEKRGEQ